MNNFIIGKLGIICDYKQDMLDYVTIGKLGISNWFAIEMIIDFS